MNRSNTSPAPAPKFRNWLLAKSRQWHLWGGLIAGLFIIVAAISGIVLNYKRPIFAALGLERETSREAEGKREKQMSSVPRLTSSASAETTAQMMARALELARVEWGDTPLERIELICKVKARGGGELWLYPATGSHLIKGEYERVGKSGANGVLTKQFDWGRFILNLHTGKIGGEVGKVVMSLAAVMLLFLTVSGVYMWCKPVLIRRRNAKARRASVPPVAGPAAAVTFAAEPARATWGVSNLSETR